MKKIYNKKMRKFRVTNGCYKSTEADGYMGVFRLPYKCGSLYVVSSGPMDKFDTKNPLTCWEHVSISHARRCPVWEEMKHVKELFWDDSETVLQFHPPKKDYVNNHPYVLHLWKPVHFEIELPPAIAVGVKSLSEMKEFRG